MTRFTTGLHRGKILAIVMMFMIFSVMFICQPEAKPLLMGGYIGLSTGSCNYEFDVSGEKVDGDTSSYGIGFALDTDTTYQSSFNYRLNVGFKGWAGVVEDEFGTNLPGISLENIFGFAIVRRPDYRWWAGPLFSIGISTGFGDEFYDDSGIWYEEEYSFFNLGLGVVTGINFKISSYATLSSFIGVRFVRGEGSVSIYEKRNEYGTRPDGQSEDMTAEYGELFANIAVLF
ncbi:hypothetical protein VU12_00340 [Desulfobulbus sp. US4]|nr:hypothetical protein [Desulfobulbus sp. US4]